MKPLNLIALLLFLAGAVWALTRSERSVREIQRTYYSAISPFLTGGSQLETKSRAFLDEAKHSAELEAELQTLRGEYGRLKVIESRFNDSEAENNRLRAALDFQKNSPSEVIASKVIRRQPSTWWQTVMIDRGSAPKGNQRSVVSVQEPVLGDGGLVGKIDLVMDNMSTVLLLTDEQCQVAAKVEGSPEIGILSGERASDDDKPRLRLRFLSRDAKLKPGMRVFTSGRGGVFPANILLGTIESIQHGAIDSEALVVPSVNFADLDTVFVLTEKK